MEQLPGNYAHLQHQHQHQQQRQQQHQRQHQHQLQHQLQHQHQQQQQQHQPQHQPQQLPPPPSSQQPPQPVFTQLCPICDKRFTRERAFSRHVSYCRRAQTTRKARPKSCFACHASKRKCTFSEPQCARCEAKGLDCVYDKPGRYKHRTAAATTTTTTTTNTATNTATANITASAAVAGSAPSSSSNPVPPVATLPSRPSHPGDPYLMVSDQDLAAWVDNVTFADPIHEVDEGMIEEVVEHCPPVDGGVVSMTGGFSIWDMQSSSVQQIPPHVARGVWVPPPAPPFSSDSSSPSDNSVDIVCPPRRTTMSTALTHLRHGNPATRLAARLATDLISAFPRMMLRRHTFPPFIHACWHLPAVPKTIANCMEIAHIFVNRTPETQHILWGSIDAEMMRFNEEAQYYSPYEVQPAAQSVLIYTIMGILDRENATSARGERLIRTFGQLAMRFLQVTGCKYFSYTEKKSPSLTWEDWVFAEERRRITCLWFVMSHIIAGYDIPKSGSDATENLPLISSRTLWEARTYEEWINEKTIYDMEDPIATFGELLRARNDPEEGSNSARLQNWEAGTDKLGVLLNVATSFVQ